MSRDAASSPYQFELVVKSKCPSDFEVITELVNREASCDLMLVDDEMMIK